MASIREIFGTLALKAGNGLRDLKTFNKSLDKSQDELGKTEKGTDSLGRRMVAMGRNAKRAGKAIAKGLAVGTGVILAGTAAIFAFTAAWATSADEIGKSGIQLNIATDALQELRFASKLAGADTGTLDRVLKDLSNRFTEASLTGSGTFVDALKDLGVEMQSLEGIPVDKKLELLSDALNKVEDGSLRTGLAIRLFGRGAVKLGVLIASGSKGIQAGRAELREFGLVMSPEMLARAALLSDTIARLGAFFGALKNIIGGKLAPVVTRYLLTFNKLLLKNKDLIALKIEKIFEALVGFIEKGIPAIADFVLLMSDLVGSMGGIDSAIRAAAEGWAVFQLAGLAVMGPGGALAAAIGLTALGIARIGRELEKQKREALDLDERLRNPDDALAGLTKKQLATDEGKILQRSALAAKQATDALRMQRSRSDLQQSQIIRDNSAVDEFAHEDERISAENTQKQIEASKALLLASQAHAERMQNIAARDRIAFDKLQAMDLAQQTAAQSEDDARQRSEIMAQLKGDGTGEGKGGRTTKAESDAQAQERRLTPAEMLAAAFGGKVSIAGNPFERLGTGSTINQIDARVFVNVGGVENTFPMPDGASVEEVVKVAQQVTAATIRDNVEEAFSHHRNVFVT